MVKLRLSRNIKIFATLIAVFFAIGLAVFLVRDRVNFPKLNEKTRSDQASEIAKSGSREASRVSGADIAPKALIAAKFRVENKYDTELRRRFAISTDYHELFRELNTKFDAESVFMRAVLLERCKGLGKTYSGETNAAMTERMNEAFVGKFIDQRKAINSERMQTSLQVVCRNFPNAISTQDIEREFKLAADTGDMRAQLFQLRKTIVSDGKVTPLETQFAPNRGYEITSINVPSGPNAEQVELLKRALASKDPTQILFAGPLLTAVYSDYEVQFGRTDGRAPSYDGFLWNSVACYFGNGCDANSSLVQFDCVTHQRCDVGSYDQLLQRYQYQSSGDWNKFLEERQLLITAIETQNWSPLLERRGRVLNSFGTVLEPKPPRFKFGF